MEEIYFFPLLNIGFCQATHGKEVENIKTDRVLGVSASLAARSEEQEAEDRGSRLTSHKWGKLRKVRLLFVM